MLHIPLKLLPETTVAGRIRYEKGWQNPKRNPSRPALYYVYEGCLRFTLGDRSIRLTAGTAFLLTHGCIYSVCAEEDCDYCYFHFSLPAGGDTGIHFEKPEYTNLPTRKEALVLPLAEPIRADRSKVEHLAAAALRYAAGEEPFDGTKLNLTLLRLLILLGGRSEHAESEGERGKSRSTYLAMRDFIEAHYTDALSLSRVSRETGISPQYAARVFRRHAGQSVTAFIQGVRLKKSQELLRYTTLSVAEIAYAVGFSSPYYYSRLFSRTFGTSPSEFRRTAREAL